jgi:hypothetical protein
LHFCTSNTAPVCALLYAVFDFSLSLVPPASQASALLVCCVSKFFFLVVIIKKKKQLEPVLGFQRAGVLRQYLHFCTSKASKLSTVSGAERTYSAKTQQQARIEQCQYLRFCTSKASKLSTSRQKAGAGAPRAAESLAFC